MSFKITVTERPDSDKPAAGNGCDSCLGPVRAPADAPQAQPVASLSPLED